MNILNKIKGRFRYRTFMRTLFFILKKMGITIMLYYWIEEGTDITMQPEIKNGYNDYTFGFWGAEEIKCLALPPKTIRSEEKMLKRLNEGKKCFGAKYRDKIAAFTWVDFHECNSRFYHQKMNENEAYLFDMYTLNEFRGRNLAPVLRIKCYESLKKMGRNRFYSISEYFNPPAIKLKKKLNSKFLSMHLYIGLLSKFHKQWVLRKYTTLDI